jgi:hypothetical protein
MNGIAGCGGSFESALRVLRAWWVRWTPKFGWRLIGPNAGALCRGEYLGRGARGCDGRGAVRACDGARRCEYGPCGRGGGR